MSPQSTDFSAEKSSILASSAAGALRGHKHLSKRPYFVVMKRGVFFSTVGLPPRPPLRGGLCPPLPSCEVLRRREFLVQRLFFQGIPRYFSGARRVPLRGAHAVSNRCGVPAFHRIQSASCRQSSACRRIRDRASPHPPWTCICANGTDGFLAGRYRSGRRRADSEGG